MTSLILQNLRCFTSPEPTPLAPLTLLVGENSTGKSTFLAAVRLAAQLTHRPLLLDFNDEPFFLGAYEQIANLRHGRSGRANSFTIGLETTLIPPGGRRSAAAPSTAAVRTEGEFVNRSSQPFLARWTLRCGDYAVATSFDADSQRSTLEFEKPSGALRFESPSAQLMWWPFWGSRWVPDDIEGEFAWVPPILPFEHLERLYSARGEKRNGKLPSPTEERFLQAMVMSVIRALPARPRAFAPIRTEPKRTYEPLKDTPRPSGSHIPMILAKLSQQDEWQRVQSAMLAFGQASGLFEGLDVRRLGQEESSPFQIRVKVTGPAFNLIDVGYGVSQILPIVVDIIQGAKGSMFLLQQPEVHLHPRAQAEFGSLLAQLVVSEKKRFVVETHSDYLIDRIRMDVRDRKSIRPEQVSILYFQRARSWVDIHPMHLDEQGNFVSVPEGYRWFFMNEESRFLGVR